MRYFPQTLVALSMLLGYTQGAEADNRSKFTVQSVKAKADGSVDLTVATVNNTRAASANFFLHSSIPSHGSHYVKQGVEIGSVSMKVGQGVHVINIPAAKLKQLKINDGGKIFVAANWPSFSHSWGTSFLSNVNSPTNFVIPKFNGPVKTGGRVIKEVVPGYTGPKGTIPLQYEANLWKGAIPGTPAVPANGKQPAIPAVRGKGGQPLSPLAVHANIAGLNPVARNFATAGSIIESEGKVSFAKKRDLRITNSLLKKMANNPKLAEKVLGKGWSIVPQATYVFGDTYMDNKTHDFAKTNAGLRKREVPGSGQPAKLNFKDAGGIQNGFVLSRTERNVDLGPKPNLKALVETKSPLNPLNHIPNAASYLNKAADQKQKRVRYQLNYAEKGGQPNAVAEITVDNVFDYRAASKNAKHKQVSFFGMEIDIAHQPVNSTGISVDHIPGPKTRQWKPTHKSADLKYLAGDKSINKTYTAINKLMDHLAGNGVKLRAAVPKYTEGLIRSGVIAPKTRLQKLVTKRDKGTYHKAKKKARNTARRTRARR